MESETPRTDEAEAKCHGMPHPLRGRFVKTFVDADFARQLERELSDCRKQLAAARKVVERWDTPLWKDVPHTAQFIERLRKALKGENENV